jgi:phospholipase/carboxylesterase
MTSALHSEEVVLRSGADLKEASGAVVLLHGRGGSAEDILELSRDLHVPGLAYLAPQAAGHTWYPYSFLAPIEQNEPWLSSALQKVLDTVELARSAGLREDQVVICGFSQGACLATEFVARHPKRYAGLIAFTGGLIGPPDADLNHRGNLDGMPALFSAGDHDPHVPWTRVEESARVLGEMHAVVTLKRYGAKPHMISGAERELARQMLVSRFRQGT